MVMWMYSNGEKEMYLNEMIIVWGIGYLGFSNLVYYGSRGKSCVGIDVVPDIKERIIQGSYKSDLLKWMNCDATQLFEKYNVDIILDSKELPEHTEFTHIICVPTEKGGIPWEEALLDVVNQIIRLERNNYTPRVLIESTMTPGTAEKILTLMSDALPGAEPWFCVSPRRDWFTSGDKTLENLPRVYGTNSQASADYFEKLLSVVCRRLVRASDYRYAEMCKSVENSLRHVSIILADQLADAFPNMDIREVLALAGTKWNIETYQPSFGPGGYCIPVSSKYVLQAAKEQSLSILKDVVAFTSERPFQIAKHIEKFMIGNRIGVMGLTYDADIKVDVEAPIKDIIYQLKEDKYQIWLNDPYYSEREIEEKYHTDIFELFQTCSQFDALIINVAHKIYISADWINIISGMKSGIQVFDNTGMLLRYAELINSKGNYHLIGTPSWNQ